MKVPRKTSPKPKGNAKTVAKGVAKDIAKRYAKGDAKRQASKDALQFAPNFNAYVLPPDVVCLYSEDRKFFLHGELYCTLASAIAKGMTKGGKSEIGRAHV